MKLYIMIYNILSYTSSMHGNKDVAGAWVCRGQLLMTEANYYNY